MKMFTKRFPTALLLLLVAGLAPACGVPADPVYTVPDRLEIEVVGDAFHWEVHYPGPDGRLGTADDMIGAQDVHIPSTAHATIHLRSRDYIYTFALPHLGLKEIAVPDLEYSLEFEAGKAGRYELRGDQMCGYTHPDLIGTLIVESPEEFLDTLRKLGERNSG